ncbi:MAG: hypothetical protein NTAFB01_30090 [Nitrospira sp.]
MLANVGNQYSQNGRSWIMRIGYIMNPQKRMHDSRSDPRLSYTTNKTDFHHIQVSSAALLAAPTVLSHLRALHDRFLSRMTARPHRPTRLIFDIDSTVLVGYGNQERAWVGYNPIKRGRPSYHPLRFFEGRTKDCWHGDLRPSDALPPARFLTYSRHGVFREDSGWVRLVIVRAPKGGFYDHALIEWLERAASQLRDRRALVRLQKDGRPAGRHIVDDPRDPPLELRVASHQDTQAVNWQLFAQDSASIQSRNKEVNNNDETLKSLGVGPSVKVNDSLQPEPARRKV